MYSSYLKRSFFQKFTQKEQVWFLTNLCFGDLGYCPWDYVSQYLPGLFDEELYFDQIEGKENI